MRFIAGQHHVRSSQVWAALCLLFCVVLFEPTTLSAAPTLTATLDRGTVAVGESATLTITIEGGQPDAWPVLKAQPNLTIESGGTSRNVTIVNGQVTSTLTGQYQITPLQAGTYIIPPVQATVGGVRLTSTASKLIAVRAADALGGTNQPLAFMRLFAPRKEVFTGESFAVELQVFVREGVLNAEEILRAFDGFSGSPVATEGGRILKTAHANRRRAQFGGANYGVSTLVTAISPVKTGTMTLKSIEVPLTLQTPVRGQRRRDVFDPFGMFQQAQEHKMVLNAEPIELQVASLPTEGKPANFNGAVGSYTIAMDAGPTNVAAGDPVTVRIRIDGNGDLESLSLPETKAWQEFKAYPPSAKIESQDPLELSGSKTFERVVVPQSPEIKVLPGISFSFFDPEKKTYRTLQTQSVGLSVRPGGSTPSPVIASPRQSTEPEAPQTPDIVPIKRRLGTTEVLTIPLVRAPWFLSVQVVPVGILIAAVLFRKRAEADLRNPRLRRRREVDRAVRSGVVELKRLAAENKSAEFFSLLFHLLQERIAERLDVPSSSITEGIVEERLRPAQAPEELLKDFDALFQSCNLARYAPVQSAQELEALAARAEKALGAKWEEKDLQTSNSKKV